MQVTRKDINALNAIISLTVEKSDYLSDYEAKLKKQQAQGQFKGFRKGKTPMGFVKKMYGNNVLIETVNAKMQEKLFAYLQDEKLNILGDPLLSEDQKEIDFNHQELQDYTFDFEIGISPEFEVQGIASTDSYVLNKVDVSESMLDDEVANACKRFGDNVEISDGIQEGDRIVLSAYELEEGKAKKEGHECNFTIFTNDLAQDYKDEVYKLKQGDNFKFDIYKVEKDKDEQFVHKYLLQLEADAAAEVGSEFEAVIDTVFRLKDSEVNQALFDKMYGEGNVDSEAAFRGKIKAELEGYYNKQSSNLMYRSIMEALIEKNQTELPSEFLMKWLKWTNNETPQEKLDEGFPDFLNNLRWTLVKTKLVEKFKIEVQPDEVKAYVTNQVMGYMGAYANNPQFVDQMVQQMLQDKKQVQNAFGEIEANKIFSNLENEITVQENMISMDEFKELVQKAQPKQQ